MMRGIVSCIAYPTLRASDADSQYFLGLMLHYGQGVEEDRQQAVNWFRKAALQGHAEAQTALAIALATGQGELVSLAVRFAVRWMHAVITSARRDAAGASRDPKSAIAWFKAAAEAGTVDGMWMYGRCVPPRAALLPRVRDPLPVFDAQHAANRARPAAAGPKASIPGTSSQQRTHDTPAVVPTVFFARSGICVQQSKAVSMDSFSLVSLAMPVPSVHCSLRSALRACSCAVRVRLGCEAGLWSGVNVVPASGQQGAQ